MDGGKDVIVVIVAIVAIVGAVKEDQCHQDEDDNKDHHPVALLSLQFKYTITVLILTTVEFKTY